MLELPVRIIGRELPGIQFGDYTPVHVGVQRGGDPHMLVPADAAQAVFDLTVTVVVTTAGSDLRGEFVQGRSGERFLYLTWGVLGADGVYGMFRRAKLHLNVLDLDELAAARADQRLEATLPLTDARGGPLCASVRPPVIEWRLR